MMSRLQHSSTPYIAATAFARYALCGLLALGVTACGGGASPSATPGTAQAKQGYSVFPSAGGNGSISPAETQSVKPGEAVTFTVTPDANYSIETVSGTCGGKLSGDTYTTEAVTADCVVRATFVLNRYSVSASASPGGSLDPETAQTADHGETVTFKVLPDVGYEFESISGCGGSLDHNNRYTTAAITADCTVTASFRLITYTITLGASANGSLDPAASPQLLKHGHTLRIDITPDEHYAIAVTTTCGGSLVGTTYTSAAITADCSVHVDFMALLAPQNPAASAGHQVNLAWTPVTGATGYCVWVSDSPGISLADPGSYDETICTGGAKTTYAGGVHGTRYYFVVTAIGPGGQSPISAEISAIPLRAPLNDTGLKRCVNDITYTDCPVSNLPKQDAESGRDANSSLVKAGAGSAGFDYTKVCNSGERAGEGACPANPVLGEGENEWACTQDNHTGLMWEMKVGDATSLHYKNHSYSWYSDDPASNGGVAGTIGGDTCNGTLPSCDTAQFAATVNAAGWCGHNDWRLPTYHELLSTVDANWRAPSTGNPNPPAHDPDFFTGISNTLWSATPVASDADYVWQLSPENGEVVQGLKSTAGISVRLVRGGRYSQPDEE
jgi:hypothetical protein